MVRDLDIRYLQGHRPSNSTASKVQTQETTAKDSPRLEKSKAKKIKSIHTDTAEPLEQNKKNKKNWWDKKWRFREKKEQSDILAIGNNAIDVSKKKKKNWDCDTSGVTCYNYNKKGYFANTCTKPKT